MSAASPLSRLVAPWLALAGLMLLAFMVLVPFLAPLAWAGILAYASWPVAEKIRAKCGGRDTLAASLTTLLAAFTLFAPLLWFAWLAKEEVGAIYPALHAFVMAPPPLPDWVRGLPGLGDWLADQRALLLADPQGTITEGKDWLAGHSREAAAFIGDVGKNLAKMLLVVMILFFFYRHGARIVVELRHVMARFLGERAHDYLAAVASTTRAVVYGVLFTASIQGVLAGLSYWVAGLGSPVTLGLLTALIALIPFGTPLVWGGAGAWLLFQGEVGPAIGVWVWGAAVVSQIDNVLRPVLISSVSPTPFLLVLFGVLGGILAFGLVGLFAGPIILAVVWAVWREWASHLEEVGGGSS